MAINLVQKKNRKQKENAPITNPVAVVGLYDRFSTYPSSGLTPEKLVSILREADDGNVYRQMELFEEMLEKDTRLAANFQTRRLAVTGKKGNVIAGSKTPRALDIAAEAKKMLNSIKGFNNAQNNQLDCVPKGISLLEIFWTPKDDRWDIEKLKYVHPKRMRFGKMSDVNSDPEEIRLTIDPKHAGQLRGIVSESELSKAATDGISISDNPILRKRFLITICQARSGNPARTSLLRSLTYLFLFKNYNIKWWIQFAEKLLGIVIGKYDENFPDQMKILQEAVNGLSSDAAAVISKSSDIEFKEWLQKAASHQTYKDIKDWVNEEYAILILGHTGTSQSTPGKLGSEDAAREVKQELIEADALTKDEAITDDVLRVWTDLHYSDVKSDEYPYYQTDTRRSPNLLEEVEVDMGIQDLGFDLTEDYVAEKYGRPIADPDNEKDKILVPRQRSTPVLSAKSRTVVGSKKKLLTGR